MRKQITIAIVVATLLVALVYASIAIGERAKGQSNNTASGNATPVKNKGMTNATTSAAKNSSGPVVGSSGGSIGGAKAVSPSK
ncbi:hypothetical protein [Nitrososphaera sp. AFS]|uniref:hypothetical protein n=1 Tax=Nitrososphaera sp. AFS TaxID=2301191 RepID=UPI001392286D|nr:hypothetical protein [Nitrososphaera sp. AFS]NAL77941.1 hypothetical protein [Nitrososphaera sp. AFS]